MDHPALDIGLRLRQAREARGLTLRDIAGTTKISMSALRAIEENKLSQLPGGLFRRAYLRAFAREVGLDGDEIVCEFRQRFELESPVPPPPDRTEVWDVRSRLIRAGSVTVTAVAIAACAAFVFRALEFRQTQQDRSGVQSAITSDAAAMIASREGPHRGSDVVLTNVAVTAPGAPSLRIEIRLTGECWVSASADGQRVLHRLMHAGEEMLIEASEAIDLHIGDAGALEYSINGKAGRRLGRDGEVVTLQVTSDNRDLYVEPLGSERPDTLSGVTSRVDPVWPISRTQRSA